MTTVNSFEEEFEELLRPGEVLFFRDFTTFVTLLYMMEGQSSGGRDGLFSKNQVYTKSTTEREMSLGDWREI